MIAEIDKKVIFLCKFGSVLYGTNNSNSDVDYKGVFVESLNDIVLKRDRETINLSSKSTSSSSKNSKNDVDIEYIELRRFLEDAMKGQTYALDMLFADSNPECIEVITPEWEGLLLHRDKLISKNMAPFISYCRQQAGKYGLKGSRLGELLRTIEHLKTANANQTLEEFFCTNPLHKSEYVGIVTLTHRPRGAKEDIENDYLEVLGKYFPINSKVKEVVKSLEIMNAKYGDRARLAQRNEGVDWKAVSHAYRCIYELEELATTGKISFPLKSRGHLKKIKAGKINYSTVNEEFPDLMERTLSLIESSNLIPTYPMEERKEFWDNFILYLYNL